MGAPTYSTWQSVTRSLFNSNTRDISGPGGGIGSIECRFSLDMFCRMSDFDDAMCFRLRQKLPSGSITTPSKLLTHTQCASVTKQYNLVRRCSAVGKVITGPTESNGSLPPGLARLRSHLRVDCREPGLLRVVTYSILFYSVRIRMEK